MLLPPSPVEWLQWLVVDKEFMNLSQHWIPGGFMSVTMACVGRRDCTRPRPSPECFSLSYLSLCDLLQSLFKYAAAQGKLVIKSQRHPLFGALSVYERQKAPKAEENLWNFFYWASETLIPSKHYFRLTWEMVCG